MICFDYLADYFYNKIIIINRQRQDCPSFLLPPCTNQTPLHHRDTCSKAFQRNSTLKPASLIHNTTVGEYAMHNYNLQFYNRSTRNLGNALSASYSSIPLLLWLNLRLVSSVLWWHNSTCSGRIILIRRWRWRWLTMILVRLAVILRLMIRLSCQWLTVRIVHKLRRRRRRWLEDWLRVCSIVGTRSRHCNNDRLHTEETIVNTPS